jgi:hypothetical protein
MEWSGSRDTERWVNDKALKQNLRDRVRPRRHVDATCKHMMSLSQTFSQTFKNTARKAKSEALLQETLEFRASP